MSFNLRLPPGLDAELKAVAAGRGISKTRLITELLRHQLDRLTLTAVAPKDRQPQ